MKFRDAILTCIWFVIAIVWIFFVACNHANEGWEWFFRLPIGVTILLLGIDIVLLKGRIDEYLRLKINNSLILFLILIITIYFASLAVAALASGNFGLAAIFGLFVFGLSNAFADYWDTTIRAKQRLETIATWCFQEFEDRQPWVMEKVKPGCFQNFTPKRLVKKMRCMQEKFLKKW